MLEVYRPEIISSLIPLGIYALGLAYTAKQKTFIKERDGNKCVFPAPHKCNGSEAIPIEERKLQVHHIIPQRYSEQVGIENPDTLLNGITLCKNAHVGPKGIHPDIATAHTREQFSQVFENRAKLLKDKKIYWVDKWDRLLHVVAMKNSQKFEKEGHIFPKKRS